MAKALEAGDGLAWPAYLAVCRPVDWLGPDEDIHDEPTRRYLAWSRWIEARSDFLRDHGVRNDDAMHDSVGDFPA